MYMLAAGRHGRVYGVRVFVGVSSVIDVAAVWCVEVVGNVGTAAAARGAAGNCICNSTTWFTPACFTTSWGCACLAHGSLDTACGLGWQPPSHLVASPTVCNNQALTTHNISTHTQTTRKHTTQPCRQITHIFLLRGRVCAGKRATP